MRSFPTVFFSLRPLQNTYPKFARDEMDPKVRAEVILKLKGILGDDIVDQDGNLTPEGRAKVKQRMKDEILGRESPNRTKPQQ